MKTRFKIVFTLSILFIFSLSFSSIISQEAPDYGKILGDWDMEVDAEGEYYYLSFNIEKDEMFEIIRFAHACGALTATGKGVIPALPSAVEVEAFLKRAGDGGT